MQSAVSLLLVLVCLTTITVCLVFAARERHFGCERTSEIDPLRVCNFTTVDPPTVPHPTQFLGDDTIFNVGPLHKFTVLGRGTIQGENFFCLFCHKKNIECYTLHGAGWTAWLPGTCQVGRLVLGPGAPPRQILKHGQST